MIHPNSNNVVNIYIVYKLDPIRFSRNTDYAIQNALFGAIDITENATGSSKNKYIKVMVFVLMKVAVLVLEKLLMVKMY